MTVRYTQRVASARALFDGSVIDAVVRRRAFCTEAQGRDPCYA